MKFSKREKTCYLMIGLFMLSLVSVLGSSINYAGAAEEIESGVSEPLRGHLDYVDIKHKTVVIDDMTFSIDKSTRYYSESGAVQTIKAFYQREMVEFKASKDMVLVEMRPFAKGNRALKNRQKKRSPAPGSKKQAIHLENGVWTN